MTEFLILLILLTTAVLFSGSETAFVTANRLRLEMFDRQHLIGSRLANYYFKELDKVLSSTLVGKTFCLVGFSSIVSGLYAHYFGSNSIVVDSLVATLTFVLVIDSFTKPISREFADYAVLILAPFIRVSRAVLFPMIVFSEWTSSLFTKLFGSSIPSPTEFYKKQDLEILIRENNLNTLSKQKDVEIISNVLSISDVRVRESMVPRTEITAIEKSSSIKEVQQRFEESGYSRMPVYDETLDKIIGLVAVQDLFRKPKQIENIISDILFVPATKKSVDLLKEFLQTGQSTAIVVDEFGGTAGLVTSEDIIEELVGDIQDEYDEDNDVFRALSDNTYLLSGRLDIERINEKFNLSIPKADYETLAGFILSNIGRIPKQGEIIDIGIFTITVSKASKTKIEVVKLAIKSAKTTSNSDSN